MLEPEKISSSRYHQLSKILQQDKKCGGADSTPSIRTCACPTLGLKHVVEQLLLRPRWALERSLGDLLGLDISTLV